MKITESLRGFPAQFQTLLHLACAFAPKPREHNDPWHNCVGASQFLSLLNKQQTQVVDHDKAGVLAPRQQAAQACM
jgi:hypothetical protein